ncbi:MAG: hypothetical protein AAGG09_11815 [Pseudomonadota bacterium]
MSRNVTPLDVARSPNAEAGPYLTLHRRASDARLAEARARRDEGRPVLSLDAGDGLYACLADWPFAAGARVSFADLYAFDPSGAKPDTLFRLTLHLDRAMRLAEVVALMDAWFATELATRGLDALPQELDCAERGVFYFTF